MRRVQLQVKRCGLDGLLLVKPSQACQAVGEGVGGWDAEVHHLLEIAVPTVRAVGDDQTTLAWELSENAGQDTVTKYKQRAATFAVAITTIKKHVNPLQRHHFASVVNPEFCFHSARTFLCGTTQSPDIRLA
jgi:hypothetical protein